MKSHYIIAFSGKARVGKNTAAIFIKKLLKNTNIEVIEESFADKLKNIARSLFFWNDDKSVYSYDILDEGRNLLINIGNKMREIRPTVWVDYILDKIKSQVEKDIWDTQKLFLITDLRYKNEADQLIFFIKNYNSLSKNQSKIKILLIRLERPGCLHLDHISEIDLDNYNKFNYTIITNDNDFEALECQLKKIIIKEDIEKCPI